MGDIWVFFQPIWSLWGRFRHRDNEEYDGYVHIIVQLSFWALFEFFSGRKWPFLSLFIFLYMATPICSVLRSKNEYKNKSLQRAPARTHAARLNMRARLFMKKNVDIKYIF